MQSIKLNSLLIRRLVANSLAHRSIASPATKLYANQSVRHVKQEAVPNTVQLFQSL